MLVLSENKQEVAPVHTLGADSHFGDFFDEFSAGHVLHLPQTNSSTVSREPEQRRDAGISRNRVCWLEEPAAQGSSLSMTGRGAGERDVSHTLINAATFSVL